MELLNFLKQIPFPVLLVAVLILLVVRFSMPSIKDWKVSVNRYTS